MSASLECCSCTAVVVSGSTISMVVRTVVVDASMVVVGAAVVVH